MFRVFIYICLIVLISCKQNKQNGLIKAKRNEINDALKDNAEIDSFIKPYKKHVNETLDYTISFAAQTYSKTDGELNTAIGNLMADAVFEGANPIFKKRNNTNIDFVLLNHGGIRAILPKGNISMRTAYKIMPFENEVVVVALKGSAIANLISYLSKAKRAHPISEALKITLNADYSVKSVLLNGKKIIPNKIYYVATSDYLFNGGDNMGFFSNNEGFYSTDYKVRNALIDYFKKRDTINPKADNRIIKLD